MLTTIAQVFRLLAGRRPASQPAHATTPRPPEMWATCSDSCRDGEDCSKPQQQAEVVDFVSTLPVPLAGPRTPTRVVRYIGRPRGTPNKQYGGLGGLGFVNDGGRVYRGVRGGRNSNKIYPDECRLKLEHLGSVGQNCPCLQRGHCDSSRHASCYVWLICTRACTFS